MSKARSLSDEERASETEDFLKRRILINDSELRARFRNAKPLYRDKKTTQLYLLKISESLTTLRKQAFTWKPELSNPVAEPIEAIMTIDTYHTSPGLVFFKPTIAEILAQIPDSLLGEKIYFEVRLPDLDGSANNQKFIKFGFHNAKTTFYRVRHKGSR